MGNISECRVRCKLFQELRSMGISGAIRFDGKGIPQLNPGQRLQFRMAKQRSEAMTERVNCIVNQHEAEQEAIKIADAIQMANERERFDNAYYSEQAIKNRQAERERLQHQKQRLADQKRLSANERAEYKERLTFSGHHRTGKL